MPAQPRKRMKGEERRDQILDVAAREFSRTGFDQTGMDAIARACGISKPVLYQHFKSKDALFTAAMADKVGMLSRAIESARQEPDPRKRIIALAKDIITVIYHTPLHLFEDDQPGDDHPLLLRFRDERRELERAIDEAVAELLPPGADQEALAPLVSCMGAVVRGAGQGGRHWFAENSDQMSIEDMAELVAALVPPLFDTIETVLQHQAKAQRQ